MNSESKACIACAEQILPGALLCKFCKTLQDDSKFLTQPLEDSNTPTEADVLIGAPDQEAVEFAGGISASQATNQKSKVRPRMRRPVLALAVLIIGLALGAGFLFQGTQIDRWAGVDWTEVDEEPANQAGDNFIDWSPTLENQKACYFDGKCPSINADGSNLWLWPVSPFTAISTAKSLADSGFCSDPVQDDEVDYRAYCVTSSGFLEVQVNVYNPVLQSKEGAYDFGLIAGEGWLVWTESEPDFSMDKIASLLSGEVLHYQSN